MTQAFDDMARERDALYQATMPRGEFAEAIEADKAAADCLHIGGLAGVARNLRRVRDAELLRLAIRGLTARQEVKPG